MSRKSLVVATTVLVGLVALVLSWGPDESAGDLLQTTFTVAGVWFAVASYAAPSDLRVPGLKSLRSGRWAGALGEDEQVLEVFRRPRGLVAASYLWTGVPLVASAGIVVSTVRQGEWVYLTLYAVACAALGTALWDQRMRNRRGHLILTDRRLIVNPPGLPATSIPRGELRAVVAERASGPLAWLVQRFTGQLGTFLFTAESTTPFVTVRYGRFAEAEATAERIAKWNGGLKDEAAAEQIAKLDDDRERLSAELDTAHTKMVAREARVAELEERFLPGRRDPDGSTVPSLAKLAPDAQARALERMSPEARTHAMASMSEAEQARLLAGMPEDARDTYLSGLPRDAQAALWLRLKAIAADRRMKALNSEVAEAAAAEERRAQEEADRLERNKRTRAVTSRSGRYPASSGRPQREDDSAPSLQAAAGRRAYELLRMPPEEAEEYLMGLSAGGRQLLLAQLSEKDQYSLLCGLSLPARNELLSMRGFDHPARRELLDPGCSGG